MNDRKTLIINKEREIRLLLTALEYFRNKLNESIIDFTHLISDSELQELINKLKGQLNE
jgi:hypothetical protein